VRSRSVHSAHDRAEYDADMLSMVDNHFHIDTSKSKRLDPRELPPSDFLMFTEDYSGERCLDALRLRHQHSHRPNVPAWCLVAPG
jgi:hypothetical protein